MVSFSSINTVSARRRAQKPCICEFCRIICNLGADTSPISISVSSVLSGKCAMTLGMDNARSPQWCTTSASLVFFVLFYNWPSGRMRFVFPSRTKHNSFCESLCWLVSNRVIFASILLRLHYRHCKSFKDGPRLEVHQKIHVLQN